MHLRETKAFMNQHSENGPIYPMDEDFYIRSSVQRLEMIKASWIYCRGSKSWPRSYYPETEGLEKIWRISWSSESQRGGSTSLRDLWMRILFEERQLEIIQTLGTINLIWQTNLTGLEIRRWLALWIDYYRLCSFRYVKQRHFEFTSSHRFGFASSHSF